MDLGFVVQIATAISLLATAVAAVVTLREYRLKVAAERRQQESAQAEIDVRLLQLFVETMRIAISRGDSHVSEKCIEQLFEREMITEQDLENPDEFLRKLRACSFDVPTGAASQAAAIAAIAVLAKRYEILRQPARAGLESMLKTDGRPEAEKALAYLDRVLSD